MLTFLKIRSNVGNCCRWCKVYLFFLYFSWLESHGVLSPHSKKDNVTYFYGIFPQLDTSLQ